MSSAPTSILYDGTTDYNNWSSQCKFYFKSQKLWEIVDGKSTCPKEGALKTAWEESNDKAMYCLLSVLKGKPLTMVRDFENAAEAWRRLKLMHKSDANEDLDQVRVQFVSFSLKPSESITAASARYEDLCGRLVRLGETPSEGIKLSTFVRATQTKFTYFYTVWDALSKNEKNIQTLYSRLIAEENRVNKACDSSEVITAFQASSSKSKHCATCTCIKKNRDSTSHLKEIVCHHCKEKGHYANRCPKRSKKKSKPKNEEKAGEASVNHAFCALSAFVPGTNVWLADTGATDHMCCTLSNFFDYSEFETPKGVRMGDNLLSAPGSGKVIVQTPTSRCALLDVLYIPQLGSNLLSLGRLTKAGLLYCGDKTGLRIFHRDKPDETVMTASLTSNHLLQLDFRVICNSVANNATAVGETVQLWHNRLGHAGYSIVEKMISSGLIHAAVNSKVPDVPCEPCAMGKKTRGSHPISLSRATRPGELFHFDIFDAGCLSLNNNKYCLIVVDDFSSFVQVHFLKNKSDAPRAIDTYLCFLQSCKLTPMSCRSDNATEFKSQVMTDVLLKHKVHPQFSTPHTPQQNGRAERQIRTVVEMARSMLANYFNRSLWAEAVNAAAHICNLLPKQRLKFKTPFELWFGRTPTLTHLRVWGSRALPLSTGHRKKFDLKCEEHILVGYQLESHAYRVYSPSTGQVKIVQSVTIIEPDLSSSSVFQNSSNSKSNSCLSSADGLSTLFTWLDVNTEQSADRTDSQSAVQHSSSLITDDISLVVDELNPIQDHSDILDPSVLDLDIESQSRIEDPGVLDLDSENEIENSTVVQDETSHPSLPSSSGDSESHVNELPILPIQMVDCYGRPRSKPISRSYALAHRPNRADPVNTRSKGKANVSSLANVALAFAARAFTIPTTIAEAQRLVDWPEWKMACDEEMSSLLEMNTWKLIDKPSDVKPIYCKWVFRVKSNPDGSVDRYKARLVVCGYLQKQGIDYANTFAPVVSYTGIRVALSIAAAFDYEIVQFDVKTAFLNGELDRPIYMCQPPGYSDGTNRVCLLQRALYGLKQAPAAWYSKMNGFLNSFGLVKSSFDQCVYFGRGIILLLYVDDGLVFGKNLSDVNELISSLSQVFEVKHETVSFYLGFEIFRDRKNRILRVTQHAYIRDTLEFFGLTEANRQAIPLDVGHCLTDQSADDQRESIQDYRSIIGKLMYLSVGSRPDISFAVGLLSRFVECPMRKHMAAARRILRYLAATSTVGIQYGPSGDCSLIGYSDADFASCIRTRKSVSGVVVLLNGGPVLWHSRKQTIISLSTTEAEYIAAHDVSREVAWLRRFLTELGVDVNGPTPVHVDNAAAEHLIRNPQSQCRTKHIDIKYHFVREMFVGKQIDIIHVSSQNQLADILTKALSKSTFKRLCSNLNIC